MSLLYQVNEKQLAGITKAPTQNPYKPAASTASPENEIPVPTQSVTDDTARQLKVFNHSISVQFSQSLKDLQKDQIELVKKIDENHAKTIFVDKVCKINQ